ncbi:MAG: hypothetical protein IK080_07160 [Clostridia bacterium]|nr:hypothetical protein [Clostridia bacterium]
MKKVFALLLAALLLFALSGCGKDDPAVKSEGVMTNEEYDAAENFTEVTIEAYVQAKQALKDGKTSLYLQDPDGAYFVYNVACDDADYAKLEAGQKVRVTGKKATWNGEIEITDAKLEILKGSYSAQALDVTDLLGDPAIIEHQNEHVLLKGLTVVGSKGKDGAASAFLYNWDGTGADGDDLYFNASINGKAYSFTVETDLCPADSEVYQAVKNLQIGDRIDLDCYLFWYEGLNPHVIGITAAQ